MITVRVTDNGTPSLSDARIFTVTVTKNPGQNSSDSQLLTLTSLAPLPTQQTTTTQRDSRDQTGLMDILV